jgi:hypothetical protein
VDWFGTATIIAPEGGSVMSESLEISIVNKHAASVSRQPAEPSVVSPLIDTY